MNVVKQSLLLAATFVVSAAYSQTAASESVYDRGKRKFEQVCIACHKFEHDPGMIAPPAFAIQMHYGERFGKDETAFRQAIVDWAKAPDAKKTLMPGAIIKFKLMPPFPLPDDDLDAIAAYLYRADFAGECNMPMRKRSATL